MTDDIYKKVAEHLGKRIERAVELTPGIKPSELFPELKGKLSELEKATLDHPMHSSIDPRTLRQLEIDNSALQNFLHEHFEDRLEDESAILGAIRLLKESKGLPQTTDWLETFSGKRFAPLSDDPQYSLKDLVWGCARECRYGGQIKDSVDHYSVAEHLCLMYDHVVAGLPGEDVLRLQQAVADGTPDVFLTWLKTLIAHDLPEGLLRDMVRPMKKHDTFYRKVEAKLWGHMASKYGLFLTMSDGIKDLDDRILVDERRQALNPSGNTWFTDSLEPLGVELKFWSPRQAAAELFARLEELGFPINE